MATKLVSRSSTLEAARTVYFIVIGLAIKQSLGLLAHAWPSKDFPNAPPWPWWVRGAVAAGYLFTVIRFSHGVTLLYGHEKERIENANLPSSTKISELSLFMVLLAIPFYLMADNITQPSAYIAWTAMMLAVDFLYILRSNVVRRPLKRMFRVRAETARGYAARAAIWWLASDVALFVVCICFFVESRIGAALIALHPSARELLFALVLILVAPADYVGNWDFYFGGRQDRRKQKVVFVISPLRNKTDFSIYKENISRAQYYCQELMKPQGRFGRRVTPLASHAFFTYFLNDGVGIDRRLGLECTLAYLSACDVVHVYVPLRDSWLHQVLLAEEERTEPESTAPWSKWVTGLIQSSLKKSVRKLGGYLGLKKSFERGHLQRFAKTLDKDHLTMGMKYAVDAAKNHGLEIKYREETDPPDEFIPPNWRAVQYERNEASLGKPSESYFKGAARKKVYVCTSFRGKKFAVEPRDKQVTILQDNTRLALWHCHELVRDETEAVAPFAPQAFYPYFWDFTLPKNDADKVINNERWDAWFERSIEMLKVCDAVYIYTPEGLPPNEFDSSEGVREVDRTAQKLGLEIQYRKELRLPKEEQAKADAVDQLAQQDAKQAQAAAAAAVNRSDILQAAAGNLQTELGANDESVQAAQQEAAAAKKIESDLATAATRKQEEAADKHVELVKTTWDPAVPDFRE
jgi:hypothetical protein